MGAWEWAAVGFVIWLGIVVFICLCLRAVRDDTDVIELKVNDLIRDFRRWERGRRR